MDIQLKDGTATHKVDKQKMTHTQGQYLAFIFWSTRVNRRVPAHSDIQGFFGVTSAAVAGMVNTLVKLGLLERQPGQPRSLKVLLPESDLPRLEEPNTAMIPAGPHWVKC
jgi:DNA-binding MarR family transcriptional regulator